MIQAIATENVISINENVKDGYYVIDVAGEMIGNSAETFIHLFEEAIRKFNTLHLMLDLRNVTYMNSYSFGIIAHIGQFVRECGRKLCIVANTALNAKFERFGFADKMEMRIADRIAVS